MKTTTFRCAIALTACLTSFACGEQLESAQKQGAELPKVVEAPAAPSPAAKPMLALPKEEPSELTTAAPAAPPSIAERGAESALEASPKSLDIPAHGAEAEAGDELDYDRPVSPSEVKVVRFVLASGVQDREPVSESDTFGSDEEKIFAFVQIENAAGAPYAFRVHFEPADKPSPYGVELKVPTAVRHRTWAYTRVKREPGEYRAVLRTLAGEEIASRPFTIEAPRDLEGL